MPRVHRFEPFSEIPNLEMVSWGSEKDSYRQGAKDDPQIEQLYETFDEARTAILRDGPIVIARPYADLVIHAPEDMVDDVLLVIRFSGRNVRRFLIREANFGDNFADFPECVGRLLSNNVVESELEETQLRDLFKLVDPDLQQFETGEFDRLDMDLFAANQLLDIKDEIAEGNKGAQFMFSLGYSVGRIFSGIQNMATLEHDARKAFEYEESYRERGRKGKSPQRKTERIVHLLEKLESLISANSALSRMKPLQVGELAIQDAAKERPELWSQGQGQLENFLTELASDPAYRQRFNALFYETG